MLRRIHSPVLLANVSDARARAFIALFTCDATARSLVISLLPLLVYAQLGDAQLVTVAYFLVALLGLAARALFTSAKKACASGELSTAAALLHPLDA